MATPELVGNRIKFSYCGVGKAIALLNGQYAVGTLEIKVVQPRLGILINSSQIPPSMKLDDQKNRSSEN